MADTAKVSIIVALLALPVGYFLHVLKGRFDKKEIVKARNRIFKQDIEHILKVTRLLKEKNFNRIVSDKFSNLADWRSEFNKISTSLNDEHAESLIKLYNIVDGIIALQKRAKEYDDNIKQKYPRMVGPYYFGDGVMNSINREFTDLVNEINEMDLEQLRSIIETNCI